MGAPADGKLVMANPSQGVLRSLGSPREWEGGGLRTLNSIGRHDSVSSILDDLQPIVVSEVARKVVDALTSNNVLGKVLTPEEADILNNYFRGKIPLNEQASGEILLTAFSAYSKSTWSYY